LVPAVTAGLAAAWLAAGSTGLLAHPLRHVLTWILLGAAVAWAWPLRGGTTAKWVLAAAAVVLAATLSFSLLGWVNVLAAAVVLALLAVGRLEHDRRVLLSLAAAVTLFALYRLAMHGIAPVWLVADRAGCGLGQLVTRLTGIPLQVGATFAGLDYLVLMLALLALWIASSPSRRLARAAFGLLAILVGHLCYLVLLDRSPAILSLADRRLGPPPAGETPFGRLPAWSWSEVIHLAIPWNVPVAAALIHLCIAGLMVNRWGSAATWKPVIPLTSGAARPSFVSGGFGSNLFAAGATALAVLVAALLPAATLSLGRGTLESKKVVAYEKGFLNWLKPKHGDYGRLSIGMYGMLPQYVESLGGEFLVSSALAEEDLRDADVLILLYPNKPWEGGQLERIRSFVRGGGSLLLMGEHTVSEDEGGGSRFNDILEPTAMRVAFDSATFVVGGWLQSYEARAHPATDGLRDDRNPYGVVIGASLAVRWPAQPLLIGRWGWNDPGDLARKPSMMGNHVYDAGERLGDLVLAAEQRYGAGRIIAFGDTSTLTNGINTGSHVFTSRLLAYLASDVSGPPSTWQGAAAVVLAAVLAVLVLGRPTIGRVVGVSLLLAVSATACIWFNERGCRVLPDGRGRTPNHLAYVDAAHLEGSSDESWRPDGTGGLMMTLMRNGYLALYLSELTEERLERAGLLITIGPSRGYSADERRAIRKFVENGGILVGTVGDEDPRKSALPALMAEYGLYLGEHPPDGRGRIPEPPPLGHFKSPYYNAGSYMTYVRFHAAWPVVSAEPDARVMAYGPGDRNVMIMRRIGKGKVVLVGDTCFAENKNLEREGGEPFEGMRENADFWRWAITYWRDQPLWVPPNPRSAAGGSAAPASTSPATQRVLTSRPGSGGEGGS